jgi:hypothetical protein
VFEPVFQLRGFGKSLPLNEEILCALLRALTAVNVAIMRRQPVPHPYRAGIRYQREPICRYCEEWRDCLEVLAKGGGDCEDLAAYLAAWWRVRGVNAVPFVKDPRVTDGNVLLYHIQVQLPSGRVVDPSRVLGMGKV